MDKKIQKKKKPKTRLLLLMSWEQKQGAVRDPALHTSKGTDRPPRPLFGLTPEHTPTLTPYEEPICPHLREQTRGPVTCFHSSFCSRNCNKSLPEF